MLGIKISRNENAIYINQSGFVENFLEEYGIKDVKPISTPMEI